MKAIKNIVILSILNLIFLLTASGQQKEKDLVLPDINQYNIKRWTGEQGIPANGVLSVMQSKDGYLYFGTYGGFIRFDGVNMKLFKKSDFKKMANSTVSKMVEDNDGTFYCATQDGIFILYRDGTEKLLTKKDGLSSTVILDIMLDSKQRLWIATSTGVDYYAKNKLVTFDLKIPAKDKNFSRIIINEDKNKNIWICASNGNLLKIKNDLIVETFKNIDFKSRFFNSMLCDMYGNIWIGTSKGIYVVKEDKTIKLITEKDGIPIDNVITIYEDNDGVIWIGTVKGICYFYKNAFSKILKLKNIPYYETEMMLKDNEGNLWVATYKSGIFRMQRNSFVCFTDEQGLNEKAPYGIFKLKSGNLLIALQYALNIWDGKKISDYLIPGLDKINITRDVFEDSKQNLWIAKKNGLVLVKDNKILKTFTVKDGLVNNYTRFVLEDNDHAIWVGTVSGLSKYAHGKWKTFGLNNGLSNEYILALFVDKSGNVWAGTKDGLNRIRNDSVQSFSVKDGLVSNIVFQMHQDITGALWITNNGGLTKYFDRKFYPIKTPYGSFFQIMEDMQGYFWMTSNDGVYRIHKNELNDYIENNAKKLEFRYYNNLDGMIENSCTANARAAIDNDHKIWICTLDGIAVVDPLNLKENLTPPVVKIEQIEINDTIVPLTKEIVIPAGNHRVRIVYTAINFTTPERVRFKYQLIGLDDGFVDIGSRREVFYPEFPTGDFTFNIIACNNDGVWNLEGSSIKIRHLPYFYNTAWFYLILSALLLLIILSLYKFRVYSIEKRATYLEQVVKERTVEVVQQKEEIELQAESLITAYDKLKNLDDFKEGMTSMIVHDLKNSLGIIINTPDRYSKDEKLEIKTRYGKQMMNLVMNILDVNKYEDTRMTLNLLNIHIFEISSLAVEQVRLIANDKNINLINNIDKTLGANADPEIIERVFINLLTNAIKYSTVNTNVIIASEISSTDDLVKIKITNTGITIPPEKHDLVFQKFGQVQPHNSVGVRSTGIGLTFCKMAIEAHSGKIDFISEPDKDTTFWFTLKKGDSFQASRTKEIPVLETKKGIELNYDEKVYLAQFLPELKKHEIYEITTLLEIIAKIENKTEQIQNWKKEFINIINRFDEKEFEQFLV